MAIYGAPSAGVALTATTGNDTIGMFGPITATPTISASTVISDAGADLINLGVQGVSPLLLQPSPVSLWFRPRVGPFRPPRRSGRDLHPSGRYSGLSGSGFTSPSPVLPPLSALQLVGSQIRKRW